MRSTKKLRSGWRGPSSRLSPIRIPASASGLILPGLLPWRPPVTHRPHASERANRIPPREGEAGITLATTTFRGGGQRTFTELTIGKVCHSSASPRDGRGAPSSPPDHHSTVDDVKASRFADKLPEAPRMEIVRAARTRGVGGPLPLSATVQAGVCVAHAEQKPLDYSGLLLVSRSRRAAALHRVLHINAVNARPCLKPLASPCNPSRPPRAA
jgi:hypothetical protein